MSDLLRTLLRERGRAGKARGIYSVCSSHPLVIRAAIQQAKADGSPLLVEATSNQVNQQGGYTGMRPKDFRQMVLNLAAQEGLGEDRILLGGDHLGPNPWQHLPAEQAMRNAEEMVKEYAEAGFTKLHLDASMACADDSSPLSNTTIAERAARLCSVAEASVTGDRPGYVIGTEVPVPGGATESLSGLEVTRREDAEETWRIHLDVFQAHGLEDAWHRVMAMVVQPGVEFNHDSVVDYVPSKAVSLKDMLNEKSNIVFEAHSTDYQRPDLYRNLVNDGFAILKVGPALTFAMREALFGLAAVERELLSPTSQSYLPEIMEEVMLASPKNWQSHYHGDARQQRILRRYSYSDRIRYYWTESSAAESVRRLMENMRSIVVPETLLSAQLPLDYSELRQGRLKVESEAIVVQHIRRALAPYAAACFAN